MPKYGNVVVFREQIRCTETVFIAVFVDIEHYMFSLVD